MFKADRRDNTNIGMDNVGGVESPAQAHLDDSYLNSRSGEVQEPDDRDGLEGRHPRYALDQGDDLFD